MLYKFALLIICLTLAGCSNEPESKQVSEPSGDLVSESVPAGVSDSDSSPDSPRDIVIDVRSKEEWDTGHVEHASHIPHTEIAQRIAEATDDKSAKIVVYCAAGGRAGKAKETLEELGFTNVENAGGYDDIKSRYITP